MNGTENLTWSSWCLYLRLLIDYTEGKNNPEKWTGYIFSVSMLFVALLQSVAQQQYFHVMVTLGLKVRTAVVGMVYSKVCLEC